ncbi:hydrolase [Hahella sp. CCB-MM4]|uniref:hydrolase n=1 Tax=Hahella sp. (strain CCB-MM4) TaxID=1926491 RepID=UPI000B9A4E24|nr:hydrolase [Hahella sp. CCB-MM4]OZG72149.1 hydrolase [Hahella sp. CCB-MM4]
MSTGLLNAEDCVLVLVDIQGKLAQLMTERESLFKQLSRLVQGALLFELPVIWMEQVPDKLGPTIAEVAEHLPHLQPIPKTSFGCYGEPAFVEALQETGKKTVLLAGIESHVCVYQSCIALLQNGYQVVTINDAISSRSALNRQLGLDKMKDAGAVPSCVEMALFEFQREAGGERFKAMSKLFRD